MQTLSENICFAGTQGVYRHHSQCCDCEMTFAVYLPPQARRHPVPALWYLSGLTCTHENAMTKAALQEHAARRGVALIFPDTSPRGEGVADDDDYALGQGAGFYVNATQQPWAAHFQMYDYVLNELPALIAEHFPINDMRGITGLTLALNNPDIFHSVSAFAPIANPSESDWGRGQLSAYLGDDPTLWQRHDASVLVGNKGWPRDVLIDQGATDQFLDLLKPEALAAALTRARIPHNFRMQAGYDHSYYFVSTFAGNHVDWHADRLLGQGQSG